MLGQADSAAFHTTSAADQHTSSCTPVASFHQFSSRRQKTSNQSYKAGIKIKNATNTHSTELLKKIKIKINEN